MKVAEKIIDPSVSQKNDSVLAQKEQLPGRLLSIDVFRAVTMFFMIFVNDVDGIDNIPGWIKHMNADTDGLGFADTIFPAFLFIVGLSLPFAIKKRLNNRDTFYSAATYILTRSIALLIMGFLHVNLENYNSTAVLPRAVWEILITIGFFLIWLDYPAGMKKSKRNILQATGILMLILMAYLYKGGEDTAPVWLKPYWWGILGIIGWSYLVCATIFLLSNGRFGVQVAAFAIFFLINVAVHIGVLKFSFPVIGNASSVSLTMAGVVVSLLYTTLAVKGRDKLLWMLLAFSGIILLIFGLIIRPYAGGISKIHATTAWISVCIGISILFFELTIYLVDIKGRHNWFRGIRPAGTSTLTSYLIPYLLYSVYALTGFNYPNFFNQGIGGIIRSLAVAFFVIRIAGVLEKRRVRLKI